MIQGASAAVTMISVRRSTSLFTAKVSLFTGRTSLFTVRKFPARLRGNLLANRLMFRGYPGGPGPEKSGNGEKFPVFFDGAGSPHGNPA